MQQPEKKKERRITTTRKQSFSLFQSVKKEIYKTAIISEFGAIMDKYMSIYGVIPICRLEVLPHFPEKQKRRSRNYLISVPIPDCWFPNFPENLNFWLS